MAFITIEMWKRTGEQEPGREEDKSVWEMGKEKVGSRKNKGKLHNLA